MKKRLLTHLLLGITLLTATVPPLCGMAQQPAPQLAVGTARLSASRGRVEVLSPTGHWEAIRGTVPLTVGAAVRTAAGAEAVATFADGSTITLADQSAIKVADMAQSSDGPRLSLKVLGDVTASISPNQVASGQVNLEFPMGRATIGQKFAMGRAARADLASSQAQVRVVTVTGSDVRIGVLQGAVALQDSFNVEGSVISTDPATSSFVLQDAGGVTHRVLVNPSTQLASEQQKALGTSDMLASLQGQGDIMVYGVPTTAEGPGDPASSSVRATIIYPQNGGLFNPEAFLNSPPLPVVGAGPTLYTGEAVQFKPRGIAVVRFGLIPHLPHRETRAWPNF